MGEALWALLVLEVTQMRPASTTPVQILKFPVQTCSYLGEALRALLVLEVRQLRLEGRNPCERTPAHLPEGATAARCSVRTASGAHAIVVLGGPSNGAALTLLWLTHLGAPGKIKGWKHRAAKIKLKHRVQFPSNTSGLRCCGSTSKSFCLSLAEVIHSVYSDS